MRIFDSILFFIAGGIAGAFACAWWMKQPERERMPAEKQHILLERLKIVSKLVTVQGDYVVNNFFEDAWMGSKTTATMTTYGKISVGYDLQKATFEADSIKKIIRVKNLPKAEILAIEHNTDYTTLSQGWWNGIDANDLAEIDDVIKKKLRDSLATAPIIQEAENQGIETLEIIKVLVEQGGWTLEVIRENPNTNGMDKPKPLEIKRDSVKKIRY
jgi:hypothetical protein